MSGFQHLADKMLRSSSRSPGKHRDSKHSDSDHGAAAAPAPIHYSSRITATRTHHGTVGGGHHHRNHFSPIVGATPSITTSHSDDTHYSSTHSLLIPDNNKKTAFTAFTASSRIPASAPSRQSVLLELEAKRSKVKQLEATVERQQRAIAALNDRVEKQGRDNANSALATRALYAELEAQTKWVEGLDLEARMQVRRGRGLLEKFAHLRAVGADGRGEGGKGK
ncbi:uncharacterized protein LTHEOB_6382 [Lasiodiplodia theobromae]|uniref:uncharacterized protein n=1 Tax=Lasiodiplodia theobromae TaxID=45133 RepID=UPI0015C30B74|nr:uncharacterized protein LTHEOB_6382 [Lasiodiplodia theobromae]KAF4544264.1 hypothetical protein LTHEOB_6382 [Lasiodiplodia theobromae]